MSFADWLKTPGVDRCYLVEIDYLLAGTGYTLRRSTHPYRTAPTDTPALTPYPDTILSLPEFDRDLTAAFVGTSRVAVGEFELFLDDELLALLDTAVFGGRELRLFVGAPDWAKASFGPVLVGRIEQLDANSYDTVSVSFRDRAVIFEKPLADTKIASGPNAGKPIPRCYGQCFNVPAVLIDHTIKKYQVHNGPVYAITQVRENGVSIPFTADTATGTFTLTNNASGRVTADVQGAVVDGVYLQTADQLIAELVRQALVPKPKATMPQDGGWYAQTDFSNYNAGNSKVVQNYVLFCEDLDESSVWLSFRVEPVTDSGIAAPFINGRSVGNYWKIVPNAVNNTHPFYQALSAAPDSGKISFLYRSGGYGVEFFLTTGTQGPTAAISEDGSVISNTFDYINVVDEGAGDYFIEVGYSSYTPEFITLRPHNGSTASFAGDGTSSVLLTGVQVSEPEALYATTTTTPVDSLVPRDWTVNGASAWTVKTVAEGTSLTRLASVPGVTSIFWTGKAFGDGAVLVKLTVVADGTNRPGIVIRSLIDFTEAYTVRFSGSTAILDKRFGGSVAVLDSIGFTYSDGDEVWVYATCAGSEIAATLWRDGEPMPDGPQLSATDSDVSYGLAGLISGPSSYDQHVLFFAVHPAPEIIGDTLPAYTLGLFIDDDQSIAAAMDEVCTSVGACWLFNRLNQVALVHFDGLQTTTDTLTPDDIEDDSLVPVRRIAPAKTVTIGYQRNWAPQGDGLAGSVRETTPELATLYEQEESAVVAENAGIVTTYPDAAAISVSTLIVLEADAETEATRRAALAAVPHTVYEVAAFASPFAMTLGQTITVEYPQYFAGGDDAVVVRLVDEPNESSVRMEVWR